MDENKPTNQPQERNEPASAPILDVQPAAPKDEPSSNDTAGPETPADNIVSQPPAENAYDKPVSDEIVQSSEPQAPAAKPEAAPAHKHGVPAVAIIVAIVIAAVLAVVTIMAFQNAEKAVAPVNNNSPAAPQQEEPVTPQSVDETTTEIDQALDGADEAADFPDGELDNQNLGL